ncbi:heme lyase CcmF/NrfE family subunit [Mesorhizobium koreense]|uniref:heme lyase CcmF/NrfE family subunit n=1 Tax=Mesorhizobium koreense TaxID=3074855 RepID=UPI00287B62B9|nr:heme lyase CcmF/NrfE family subunit [Mesorhizobium sp. WR6]
MVDSLIKLGQLAVCLALVLSVYAVVQAVLSVTGRAPARLRAARNVLYANVALVSFGCVMLIWSFATLDFSVAYVAQNGSSQLPMIYRLTAMWGAHEGSLMLWLWYLTILSAVAAWLHFRDHPLSMPWVIATLATVQLGFLAFIVFLSNPFLTMTPPLSEGQDLNPLLQDPGLVFHPPVLYLGYVGFAVPFAFALASLIRTQAGTEWVRVVRGWTLFAWTMLTSGILMGGFWAYYELGWGGYWGWDPVENASLMPWLTGTALLHSMMAQDKRGLFRTWNVFLVVTTFLLTLIGTFLVRSGVLTSVHAFAVDPGRGAYMLGFLTMVMLVGYGLIILRAERLSADTLVESAWSRESAILANNVLLLVAAATVFVGMLYPLFVEAVSGERLSVGAPYFNKVVVPLMLAVVFLLGIGPSIPWRRMNPRRLAIGFRVPVLAAVLALVVTLAFGVHNALTAVAILAVSFAAAATLVDVVTGVVARQRTTCEPLWLAAARAFAIGRRRYGGLIVHFGIALIGAGIIASGLFQTAVTVSLKPGDSFELAGNVVTLRGVEDANGPGYSGRAAALSVSKDGVPLTEMRPEKRFYRVRSMATTEIAIRSSLAGDLYMVAGDETAEGGIVIRGYWNPLVNWIWTGWLVVAFGALLSLSSARRKRAPRAVPATGIEGVPAE